MHNRWSIVSEIQFLNKLGMWLPEDKRPQNSAQYRIKLLERYLAATSLRTDWDDLEREAILTHARNLLAKVRAKARKAA